MPAVHKLPEKYTANQIIGVTKGSSRPTVYFSDGSRYTQIHKNPENIGYHEPEELIFFGNISEFEYQKKLGARSQRSALRNDLRNGKPMMAFRKPGEQENCRLFEVKRTKDNAISTHASRAKLQIIGLPEKFKILLEIRTRSAIKEKVGEEYQYR